MRKLFNGIAVGAAFLFAATVVATIILACIKLGWLGTLGFLCLVGFVFLATKGARMIFDVD